MKLPPATPRDAFSLFELAIVLAIVAFLAGGIMGGRALIRSGELRAITTQYESYNHAVTQFYDQYRSLPGDMPNATDIWTAANADATICAGMTASAFSTATCNGDGDDNIELLDASISHETFRFWQHLYNAELIDGNFSAIPASGANDDARIGSNIPKGPVKNTGFSLMPGASYSGHGYFYDGSYPLILSFGKDWSNSGSYTRAGAISPEDAWSIDHKMDDDLPAYGNVRGYKLCSGSTCPTQNCTTTANASTARWNQANAAPNCALLFTPHWRP